jgi:Tol biopolymer transport system component/DNA-binding winged helix-turn-helix (wHTH) protein
MSGLYEFGKYTLDATKRQLTRDGQPVALTPKSFELLLLFVASDGRALSKSELMQALWPDAFVEEANLSFQISVLRKILDQDGSMWIETVPKHGYRFAGTVARREEKSVAATGQETPPPVAGKTRRFYLVSALAVGVGAATMWTVKRRPSAVGAGPHNPQPLTSHAGFQQHPSLSPDGSQVAYSWDGPNEDNFDIYVKLVGPGEPVRLTRDPALDVAPAWSPDGRQIAFIRFASGQHGSIFLIPALGGAEWKLADIEVPRLEQHASRLSWSPDSRHIAFGGKLNGRDGSGIWLIAVDRSGQPRRLTVATDSAPFDFGPAFSPNGRSLAFIRAIAYNSADLYVQRLAEDLAPSGEPNPATYDHIRIETAAWVNDRKLIYCAGFTEALRRLKTVEIAADGKQVEPPQTADFGEGAQSVSTSRTGNLIYARLERDVNLWRIDLSDGGAGPERLAASRYQNWTAAWSHDGLRIAFASTRSGIEEIWVADADGSRPMQITRMGSGHTANPRWSRDDRVILFNSWKPRSNLYTVDVTDGSVKRLTQDDADDVEASWSRNGKWIYCGSNRSGRLEIYRLPASGGAPVPITRNGGLHAEESADGWLYFSKDADSPTAIWKIRWDGGEEMPVVDGLSYSTNFALSDKGIYFVSGRIARNSNAIEFYDFATSKRKVLARLEKAISWGIALSPDQRSLVYSLTDRAASNLMLVENFR